MCLLTDLVSFNLHSSPLRWIAQLLNAEVHKLSFREAQPSVQGQQPLSSSAGPQLASLNCHTVHLTEKAMTVKVGLTTSRHDRVLTEE